MPRFILLFLALVLNLAACSRHRVYTAPILPYDLSEEGIAGKTTCSLNNLPVALIDHAAWTAWTREFILVHEQDHADAMFNYKGGCWAFLYKYNEDINFRLKTEYRAYCKEGRFAVERNVNPREVWSRIKSALANIDSVRSSSLPNCIY